MSSNSVLIKDNNGFYHTIGFASFEEIVNSVSDILFENVSDKDMLTSSLEAARFLQLKLASEPNELFAVLYLDSQNRVISFEKLFIGTINHTVIHPRIVVQKCLKKNAAAVIFAHNHPSGVNTPSRADIQITEKLKTILDLIDVRTLDHLIVSGTGWTSLAEQGAI